MGGGSFYDTTAYASDTGVSEDFDNEPPLLEGLGISSTCNSDNDSNRF